MFSKISRYRKVPDVTAPDAQGRLLESKGLRLLPDVTGTFIHTVDAGDRLDQLGYKYYSQPLQWWRICDANPEVLSPLALLGKEVLVTTRFPVSVAGGSPPWAALFKALAGTLGVEDAVAIEDVDLVPTQQAVNGKTVTVVVERYNRAVRVTYNRLNVTAEGLADSIEAAGFEVGQSMNIGQVGQGIVIPPKPTG